MTDPIQPKTCWDCGTNPAWTHSEPEYCKRCHSKAGYSTTVEIDKDEYEALAEAVRRLHTSPAASLVSAAQVCDDMAEMMEAGAGEAFPGQRLRQAARQIRRIIQTGCQHCAALSAGDRACLFHGCTANGCLCGPLAVVPPAKTP